MGTDQPMRWLDRLQRTLNSLAPLTVSTATITATSSILLVSQVAVAANANRKGLIIYNNSANSVYIAFDSVCASGSHMTYIIPTFASWTMPTPMYLGPIAAIRNSGSGALFITELS